MLVVGEKITLLLVVCAAGTTVVDRCEVEELYDLKVVMVLESVLLMGELVKKAFFEMLVNVKIIGLLDIVSNPLFGIVSKVVMVDD